MNSINKQKNLNKWSSFGSGKFTSSRASFNLGFNVFFEIELIACRGIINKEMLFSLLKIPKVIGI